MNELISPSLRPALCRKVGDSVTVEPQVESAGGIEQEFSSLLDNTLCSAPRLEASENAPGLLIPLNKSDQPSSEAESLAISPAHDNKAVIALPLDNIPARADAGNMRGVLLRRSLTQSDLVHLIDGSWPDSAAPVQRVRGQSSDTALDDEIDEVVIEDGTRESRPVMFWPPPLPPLAIAASNELRTAKNDSVSAIESLTGAVENWIGLDVSARTKVSDSTQTEERTPIATLKPANQIPDEVCSPLLQEATAVEWLDREAFFPGNHVAKRALKTEVQSVVTIDASTPKVFVPMPAGDRPPPSPLAALQKARPMAESSGLERQEGGEVWAPALSRSAASDPKTTEALSIGPVGGGARQYDAEGDMVFVERAAFEPTVTSRFLSQTRVLEVDQATVAARITQPLAAPLETSVSPPAAATTFKALRAASACPDDPSGEALLESPEVPARPSAFRPAELSGDGPLETRERPAVPSSFHPVKAKELGLSQYPIEAAWKGDRTTGANASHPVRSVASFEISSTPAKEESKIHAEIDNHDVANAFETIARVADEMQTAKSLTTHEKSSREVFQQVTEPIVVASRELTPNEPKTLRLKLRPKEMGEVEVEIRCDAAGRISARLNVEYVETGRALNHGIVELRDALERAGLDVGRLDVSAQSNDSVLSDAGQSGSQWTAGSHPDQSDSPKNFYHPAPKELEDELELESTRNGGSKAAQDRLLNLHA